MLKPRHVEQIANPSALIVTLLADEISVAFEAHGSSMSPTILHGDKLLVRPAGFFISRGDVVLAMTPRGLTAHRVVRIEHRDHRTYVVMRGDNADQDDAPVEVKRLLGRVVEVTRDGRPVSLDRRSRPRTLLWRLSRRVRSLAASLFGRSTQG